MRAELAPRGLRRHQERRGEAMREALILLLVAAALHDEVTQLVRGIEAPAVGRRLRVEHEDRRGTRPAGETVESPRLRPSEDRPATFLDQADEVVDGAVAQVPPHPERGCRVVATREVAHGDRAGEVVPLVEVEQRPQAELALQALGRDGGDSLLTSLAELRQLAERLPADVDPGLGQQRRRPHVERRGDLREPARRRLRRPALVLRQRLLRNRAREPPGQVVERQPSRDPRFPQSLSEHGAPSPSVLRPL